MPMDNVKKGIEQAAALADASAGQASHAAEAIMTSDTRPKEVAVEFKLGGDVRLGGMCKGAGMIQPGMSPSGARAGLASAARHDALLFDHRRRHRGKDLAGGLE
jgi:hypothetical protein